MADQQPEPATPSSSTRTFKLYEFHTAFGRDMHHFVFIQRESNSEALATFEENLEEDSEIKWFSRVYTETDIKNIHTSCGDILRGFLYSNDCVSYQVVLGKIDVQPRGSTSMHEWFDRDFDDKDPNWATGFKIDRKQVLDLERKDLEWPEHS